MAPTVASGRWPGCRISYTCDASSCARTVGSVTICDNAALVIIQASPPLPGDADVGVLTGAWVEQLASPQARAASKPSTHASRRKVALTLGGRAGAMSAQSPRNSCAIRLTIRPEATGAGHDLGPLPGRRQELSCTSAVMPLSGVVRWWPRMLTTT